MSHDGFREFAEEVETLRHTPGGDTVAAEPEFTLPPFEEWEKMERYRQLSCTITEKIDGTNAQIVIPHNPKHPVIAGSRTRYLINGATNFGFERWVAEHAEALRRLGPGKHYGEWWGAGIQRTYGLEGKRFSLFNTRRWTPADNVNNLPEGLPPEVGVVPVLYRGVYDPRKVDEVIAKLFREGSVAAPGWRGHGKAGAEGVVIQVIGSKPWKLSDGCDAKKGRHHHVLAAAGAVAITPEFDVTGVFTGTKAVGCSMNGEIVVRRYDAGTDEQAARLDLASHIVDLDAAYLDARKAAESVAQS